MTAGDYLNSISTVTAVGAGIHLLNIETGTGADRLVPFTDIECDLIATTMEASLTEQTLTGDLEIIELDAILTTSVFSADLIDTTMDGELSCQL